MPVVFATVARAVSSRAALRSVILTTSANVLAISNGQLAPEKVRLENSSLASQVVAPPLNPVEMSYEGRTWADVARKLLGARPLEYQQIAPDDSVLADYADP